MWIKTFFFLSEIKKIYQVCGYLFFRSITWVNSSVNILSFFSGIAEPIATNLGIKHLWVNRSINCEIHGLCPPPWGLRDGAKTIKINAIFKNLLIYPWASGSQTVGMIVISIEPSTKILKFIAPGSGFLVLGQSLLNIYWKYIISLKIFSSSLWYFGNELST